jgi:glycosyltransferase 2 family protein
VAGQTTNEKERVARPAGHVEDPTIEQLAEVAGHTDDVAVRRTLFGRRELISTLIPIALLVLAARNVDWGEAARALGTANPYFVLLALVVNYATFPLRSWRWAMLMRQGGARLTWRDLLKILFIGWFVNSVVPAKLGDLYRSYLVKRKFGISLSRTVGVVVAERLLDLMVVFALLIVGGYVAFGRTILPDLTIVYVTGTALAALLVIGFVAIYFVAPKLARFFPGEVRRIGRLFREGVLHSFRALPTAGALTLVIWSLEAVRLFLVLTSLGLGLAVPASGVVFVAVAVALLTTVPLTPAGFGFVEIAMVYVLTEGFGLVQHDAIAVAVVDRAVTVLSVIIIGGIVYWSSRNELHSES